MLPIRLWDGVAIKFVAYEWVSAPAAENADALRVAEAVRHIEIGLSSFAQLVLSDVYPKWLRGAAVAVGIGYIVLGVVAHNEFFSQVTLPMLMSMLLALWVLVLAFFLWCKAGKSQVHKSFIE
jgi:hypothetical protein